MNDIDPWLSSAPILTGAELCLQVLPGKNRAILAVAGAIDWGYVESNAVFTGAPRLPHDVYRLGKGCPQGKLIKYHHTLIRGAGH